MNWFLSERLQMLKLVTSWCKWTSLSSLIQLWPRKNTQITFHPLVLVHCACLLGERRISCLFLETEAAFFNLFENRCRGEGWQQSDIFWTGFTCRYRNPGNSGRIRGIEWTLDGPPLCLQDRVSVSHKECSRENQLSAQTEQIMTTARDGFFQMFSHHSSNHTVIKTSELGLINIRLGWRALWRFMTYYGLLLDNPAINWHEDIQEAAAVIFRPCEDWTDNELTHYGNLFPVRYEKFNQRSWSSGQPGCLCVCVGLYVFGDD